MNYIVVKGIKDIKESNIRWTKLVQDELAGACRGDLSLVLEWHYSQKMV